MLAVIAFAILLMVAARIAGPLGIAGGFVVGAANALVIGATLSLVEQAVKGARRLTFQDVLDSVGHYFWDVISVGFVLWVPMMLLDASVQANPASEFLVAAILLLLFILLNPAPEVIYQTRHDSPLDVFKTSYEFIIENWVEWFLPMALVLAPLGFSLFVHVSSRFGRGAGLDFFQLLMLPFVVLRTWLDDLGVSPSAISLLALILTPFLTVAMLLFRGHLFSALHGTSRRQRLFRTKFETSP